MSNKPTIKALLAQASSLVAESHPCKRVTLIVCCEAEQNGIIDIHGENTGNAVVQVFATPWKIGRLKGYACSSAESYYMNFSENPVIINNKIKKREANQLLRYLNSFDRGARATFVKAIANMAGVDRRVVYSWCYAGCRIPNFVKEFIEKIAGKTIFIKPINEAEEA